MKGMKVVPLDLQNENLTQEIMDTLKKGRAVVYPTDTLYGFGVNALDKVAVDRLFRIKQRPPTKPMPLVVRDIAMARRFAYIDVRTEKILSAIWPGPTTVVLARKDLLPSIVTGGKDTVGIRIPDHEFIKNIMDRIDFPITSTSVNISGQQSLRKVDDIIKVFENEKYQPDIILNAGYLPESHASTVIDLTTRKPKIIRVGPVKPEELLKILEM